MLTYIGISIIIYLILSIAIVILAFLLKRKSVKAITEDNDKVLESKKLEEKINNLTEQKKFVMEGKIEKATNVNDYINIFTEL
jgi:hypothetical protein